MTKRIGFIGVVMAFLLTASTASAQVSGFVGFENKTTKAKISDSLGDATIEKVSEKSHFGGFIWTLTDAGGFAEIYGGPAWYPREWVELQLGVGVENHEQPWRVGGSVFLSGQLGTVLLAMENGGSGFWYKATYAHKVNGRWNIGVFSRRFAGTGPLVEYQISKNYKFWATAGPDLGDKNHIATVVGLNISLPK